jgi:hypothetical protein
MPMHEQILRKEQDPFHKSEDQAETAPEHAAAASQRRVEAEERVLTAAEPTTQEQLAPSVMAHLPGMTGASDEAVKHLFMHFSERERKGGQSREELQRTTSTQTDPRTSSRAREPRGHAQREPGEEFKDGFAADFMPDSQFAGADLDDRPSSGGDADLDAWDGESGPRRRRRGTAAPAAVKKSTKGEGKP